MKASTGDLIQALSVAAVNDGTAGLDRFTKAHCLRSVSEYVPRGATASAAKASDVLTCAVCKGDSCETTGDRFKIRLRDRGTIELLNNDTGVTATVLAGGESEGTEKLAAGGEHGSFLLKKAALKACGR